MNEIDVNALSPEDKTILFWAMVGHVVRRWTPEQETMFLLGELACPSGHVGKMDMFWVDGMTSEIRSEGQTRVEQDLHGEGFSLNPDFTAFGCRSPGCDDQVDAAFYVPPEVRKHFGL